MYQLYRPDPAEPRPIDLEAVLRDVSQIMAGLLRQHRLTLRTEVAPDLPQVRLPQRDLIQVLCNLIRNAIEASRPAGDICLSVRVTRKLCRSLWRITATAFRRRC